MKRWIPTIVALGVMLVSIAARPMTFAQQQAAAVPPLGDGPWLYDTSERGTRIRVSVVTKGLSHPWSMVLTRESSAASH